MICFADEKGSLGSSCPAGNTSSKVVTVLPVRKVLVPVAVRDRREGEMEAKMEWPLEARLEATLPGLGRPGLCPSLRAHATSKDHLLSLFSTFSASKFLTFQAISATLFFHSSAFNHSNTSKHAHHVLQALSYSYSSRPPKRAHLRDPYRPSPSSFPRSSPLKNRSIVRREVFWCTKECLW